MRALLTGELFGPLEMRFVSPDGVYYSREVDARPVEDPARGTLYVGYAKDITDQKNQTQELLEQARHDSLTQLYNNRTGKELIDRYLQAKDPYAPAECWSSTWIFQECQRPLWASVRRQGPAGVCPDAAHPVPLQRHSGAVRRR